MVLRNNGLWFVGLMAPPVIVMGILVIIEKSWKARVARSIRNAVAAAASEGNPRALEDVSQRLSEARQDWPDLNLTELEVALRVARQNAGLTA